MENERPHPALSLFRNANWAAFAMAVTLLSIFNSFLMQWPLPGEVITELLAVNAAITLILWIDFFRMWRVAPDGRIFWREYYGWLALLGSIPFLRILRMVWFWLVLKKVNKRPRDLLARISVSRDAEGTLLGMLLVVIVVFQFAVVFILVFESVAPNGNIHSVNDAFWWAFVTVSTVGYGDKFPVTVGGRIIGAALIFVGVALFSVITGTLTQWFLGKRQSRERRTRETAASLQQRVQTDAESSAEAIDLHDIKTLLEQQAAAHQQSLHELHARLAHIEAQLKDRAP